MKIKPITKLYRVKPLDDNDKNNEKYIYACKGIIIDAKRENLEENHNYIIFAKSSNGNHFYLTQTDDPIYANKNYSYTKNIPEDIKLFFELNEKMNNDKFILDK